MYPAYPENIPRIAHKGLAGSVGLMKEYLPVQGGRSGGKGAGEGKGPERERDWNIQ
jgi:hypothetical protein